MSTADSQWNRRDYSVYSLLSMEQEGLQCLQLTLNGTGETAVSTTDTQWNRRDYSLQLTLNGTGDTTVSTANSQWNRRHYSVYS